jgi:catechol 2,3-dioxygenase-like lactoylglutathione lyase family enzyme
VVSVGRMTASFSSIGLVVADLAASVAFYRRLGLAVEETSEEHAECVLPGGPRLTLDTERAIASFTPGWTRPTGSPRVSLGFALPRPSDVDDRYAELVAAGCTPGRKPWDAFWGQRYASVHDPDGNEVDLYADLPE